MTNKSDWAASWLATKLRNDEKKYVVKELSSTHLLIERPPMRDVVICATTLPKLGAEELQALLEKRPKAVFYVAATKETVLLESAFSLAKDQEVAIGRVGDLMNALNLEKIHEYVNRTVHYIEQGMLQHKRITSFERVGELIYIVRTKSLGEQLVAFFNEYELTADILRKARADKGYFDLAVNLHIAGSPTEQALEVAENIGAEILKWSEFFTRMHTK